MVKFLVVGDLHGDIPKIHTNDFDAIIAPGDFCGDEIRPFILKYLKKIHESDEAIDFDDICPPKKQEELEKLSVKKGREVLKSLNKLNKPVFVIPGNWDPTIYQDGEKTKDKVGSWEQLLKGLDNVKDIEYNKTTFKGIDLIGHGSTSGPEPMELIEVPEPLDTMKEFKEINQRANYFINAKRNIQDQIKKSKKPIILVTHNVPYNTKLDLVHNPGTSAHNKHYGSILAREIIDENKPLLCIGGHIHEGYGEEKVGKTLCVNAGFGGNVNTIIEINTKEKKVIKVEFIGKNKENH